jgi:hypothetical protein
MSFAFCFNSKCFYDEVPSTSGDLAVDVLFIMKIPRAQLRALCAELKAIGGLNFGRNSLLRQHPLPPTLAHHLLVVSVHLVSFRESECFEMLLLDFRPSSSGL